MRRAPALLSPLAPLLFALLFTLAPSLAHAADLDGATLSPMWALPFAGTLLSIALFPLIDRKSVV